MTNSFFFNSQTGYVTGRAGRLLGTTNSGVLWNPLNTGYNNDFYGVYFTDNYTGYVVGTSGLIIKTANSGLSWSVQNSGLTSIVFSVFFVNSNTGYAGGQEGLLIPPMPETIGFRNFYPLPGTLTIFIS